MQATATEHLALPSVSFVQADGCTETIDAESGNSLMHAAITNGIYGIEAECGGGLVCGTCHVYVNAAWLEKVGPPSSAEEDVLDGVNNVRPSSRLSCQINMTPELEGLLVTIPACETHRSSIEALAG